MNLDKITQPKEIVPIKEGEIVILSSGEYSDYSYILVCRALRGITEADLRSLLPDCRPDYWREDDDEPNAYDEYKLALELTRRRWVEDIPYREIHTGSYGRFDP